LEKAAPTFSTFVPLPRIDIDQGFGCRHWQHKEVGTLSLWLPMDLGEEHQINFEVNLEDFSQSDFLEIWVFGRVEP